MKPEQRPQVECACKNCQDMCRQSPCFPTPEEVEKLMDAGHADRLALTIWIDPIDMITRGQIQQFHLIAPERIEGHGCTFLNAAGLCELHGTGLKPLEGRLASCKLADNGLRKFVAQKWISVAAAEIFPRFVQHIFKSEAKTAAR